MEELLQYVSRTWVANGATFPPELWNTYDATMGGKHRTNNNLEGWHRRFASMISASHPTLWKFIQHLIIEEDSSTRECVRLEAGGQPQPSRLKYRLLNEKLQTYF